MAYDPRSQYRAPPGPYHNNRAPQPTRQPPPQAYPNQDYSYTQDPYAPVEQGSDSYKGYDGDGFWDDYAGGYDEGYGYDQQYQYAQDDQYGSQQIPGQAGQHPPPRAQDIRGQPQPYPQQAPQGRVGGHPAPVNGQMRPPADPRGRGPPHAYGQPPNQQMQNGYGQPPSQMRNDGYGQLPPIQRSVTLPAQMQNDSYNRPATAPQGGTPPRQRLPRKPLVASGSPETLPFDNPFPVFPNTTQKPKPQDDEMAEAMGAMDINGRPSTERQRRPTDASQASQQPSHQGNQDQRDDSYSNHPQQRVRRPSVPEDRGPPRRAFTLPQEPSYQAQSQRPQQGPNDWQRNGYDAGPDPMAAYRDPIQQRSFTTQGERPPPQRIAQMPLRSQSSMGQRGPPNGYRHQPSFDDNMAGRGAPRMFQQQAPPLQQQTNVNSYGQDAGRYQINNAQQSVPTQDHDLESYMPDFDARPPKPLEDPIGLPLDAAAGKRSGPNSPGLNTPEIYQQPHNARSQPELRSQDNGPYHTPVDAPPMPRGPPMGQDPMRRQMSPPYANGAMNDAPGSNYPTQGQGRWGPPNNQHNNNYNRPDMPRNQTDSAWSDMGPNSGSRMNSRPRPPRPSVNTQIPASQTRPLHTQSATEAPRRQFNPDTLPAHPVPIRPGLMQNNGTPSSDKPPPIRQYDTNSPAESQQASGSDAKQQSRRQSSIPVTFEEINQLRAAVKANPRDNKQELHLAKRLASAAVTLVDDPDPKVRTRKREEYMLEAHKHVKKLASQGYSEAMFYLADCHGTGQLGLAIDPKEAFNLYQGAAKLGHAASAYRTAVCCEMGTEAGGGTRKDPLKAVQWYRRAATLGDVPAMYKLGMILLRGLLGQQASVGEAMIWLQRAAERADEENPHALHEVACLYDVPPPGSKVIRDEGYALQLFEQAAKLGYRVSQARLGKAYEYGQLGCKVDNRNSIHWYSKAAAQGDVEAELALSGWYLTGSEGILQQSDTEAYLWARKAAMREFPKAEFAMGYYSEVGIGCPKSLEDAKRWYGRAAAHKYPKAHERLEELKRGGAKVQKTRERLSRSDARKHGDECVVM